MSSVDLDLLSRGDQQVLKGRRQPTLISTLHRPAMQYMVETRLILVERCVKLSLTGDNPATVADFD